MRLVAARAAAASPCRIRPRPRRRRASRGQPTSLASTSGPGERLLLVQVEAQRHVQRALDAVDADLAIALRGVPVAATEQRAVIEDRQVERGAGAELAHIEIAAEGARWPGAECAVVGARNAHHAAETAAPAPPPAPASWSPRRPDAQWKRYGSRKRSFRKPRPGITLDHPQPLCRRGQHVDLQHVARLRAFHRRWAGERVNAAAVDAADTRRWSCRDAPGRRSRPGTRYAPRRPARCAGAAAASGPSANEWVRRMSCVRS